MDVIEEDVFNLTEDAVCDIQRRFCKFYLKFIKDYFNLDKNFVWKEISNHRTYKKKYDYVTKQAHELFLSCIQDTCLGLQKFHALLVKYKEMAKYLSKKNPLVIYCVIGESILAALGICIVIDKAVERYRTLSTNTETKRIHLIVTEKNQNWRTMCSYIAERVNSCYKNVKIELVLFDDLSDRLSLKAFHAIKEADIVVMSRYLYRFDYLTAKPLSLEITLTRMKDLSILFFLDACQKRYQNTVKHVFSKIYSLIEIRSKKTTFQSLQNTRNEEYFSKFPFLSNASFEKVMYSICIKCSGVSYNKSAEIDAKDDVMKRKISKRYAREKFSVSQLKSASEKNSFINKRNAEVLKRNKVHGNSVSRNLERNNKGLKLKKPKVETAKTGKVFGKSITSNLQNKKTYKCLYLDLEVDEPIPDYATFLSEIYYSKYFDKEIPGCSKIKLNKTSGKK